MYRMPATTLVISASAVDDLQHELVRTVLSSQRQRLAALIRTLDDEEWSAQSRCSEWSVHEVVRHLCDATLRGTELLRDGRLDDGGGGFDPRTTPLAWLARSDGERP